jgi:hypothetical protein
MFGVFSKEGHEVISASAGIFLQLSIFKKTPRLRHRKAKEKGSARSVEDSKIAENGFAARSLNDHGFRNPPSIVSR